eukprot:m.17275 g.17275  ORF g.17275 m.17275 type:complete len:251 (+) comp27410_c0_seq1:60-812(+)
MSKTQRFLLVALLISAGGIFVVRTQSKSDWDFFLLAFEWIPAFCKGHGVSQCRPLPKSSVWTIHGLWPSKNDQHGPTFCSNSITLKIDDIQDLKSELDVYWPNAKNKNSFYFWNREWKKHGTCSLSDPIIKNSHDYFSAALRLFRKYDIYSILANSNILPGGNYVPSQFMKAFERLDIQPVLRCVPGSSETSDIQQLYICFDKNLNPCQCRTAEDKTCSPGRPFSYLSPQKRSWNHKVVEKSREINFTNL